MTIYDHIKSNLLKHSWMKSDRHRAIESMLKEKYGENLYWDKVREIAQDWLSYDRVFRLCQSENPELRGQNWEEQKKIKEQKFEVEVLGREVGYNRDVKTLRML
jgi:hypothetical protein